jgi:hypothetical protein
MNASRQHMSRAIDYSAVKNPDWILSAIQALLSRRANPMREKEIAQWFRGTPAPFVSQALVTALDRNLIKAGGSLNRNRSVLVYWIEK